MAEILTQAEIDNLLSGITSGATPEPSLDLPDRRSEKDVVAFDFRLPHRLSKNQLRTLQAVHETFGEALGSYLLSRLQTQVTVSVASVDQLFYSDYVLSIGSPSCLYIFRIVESDAMALLEVSPQLVLSLVERLLGGAVTGDKKSRLITKLEQSIVKGIVQRMVTELQKAWEAIAPLTFQMERYETEGDFTQIAPASEIVLVISFEVAISDQKFLMNLCFPTFALEDVLAKLNLQNVGSLSGIKTEQGWMEALARGVSRTSVDVTGVLGMTTLTLAELMELQEGDVIRTNINVASEVLVKIGGKTRMWGTPGESHGKKAVKIIRLNKTGSKEEE